MRGRRLLLLPMAFGALAAGTASAGSERGLVITGDLQTSSAQGVPGGGGNSCGYRPDRTFAFSSNAFRIGRGPEVARVSFVVRDYRGPQRYNAAARYKATLASFYHRTAAEVTTADNAAKGVASSSYISTSGILRVVRAKNVGRHGRWASLSGTVNARLRLPRNSEHLRLDGTWHCRIEPVANGIR
jgi:hypothetical protein